VFHHDMAKDIVRLSMGSSRDDVMRSNSIQQVGAAVIRGRCATSTLDTRQTCTPRHAVVPVGDQTFTKTVGLFGHAEDDGDSIKVGDNHALTARLTAASRAHEHARKDSLFSDPLARKLAGREGRPHGRDMAWVVVPRTRFIDDTARTEYTLGTRQFVIVGAGMDTRAFRMNFSEAHFFEVDKGALFSVKEPLLQDEELQCLTRSTISMQLGLPGTTTLSSELKRRGFDPQSPSFWILEGLIMYLNPEQVGDLIAEIGKLVAVGSGVVHDAVTAGYMQMNIQVCGAPFLSGHDDYGSLWSQSGFSSCTVIEFDDVGIDRAKRVLRVSPRPYKPDLVKGSKRCLFVQAKKVC